VSQENIDLVRAVYAASDPLTTLADRVAPDIEVDFTAVYPDQPVLRGLEAVRRFRTTGPWGTLSFEPERYLWVDEGRILVIVKVTASGRESGVPVANSSAHEFTVRDGLITRLRVFGDRREALEAVGLSE
jgi:ketosteroid isomerase-like protein